MSSKPENPFFVLKFGKRLATENMVIGFVPWILLTALEIEFCVLAWSGQSMNMSWYLIIGQIFLLGPVLGYFAQLQGIRCLENIFRRVRYEELMVTPVNGDDFIGFSLGKVRKASWIGLGTNLITGTAPLMYLSWLLEEPNMTGWIIAITFMKIIFVTVFLRHALLIGIERLLLIKGYVKSRVVALMRVILELYGYGIIIILMLAIIPTILFLFRSLLYMFMTPLVPELYFLSYTSLVVSILIYQVIFYTLFLIHPKVRSKNYQKAHGAIEKWRLHEDM